MNRSSSRALTTPETCIDSPAAAVLGSTRIAYTVSPDVSEEGTAMSVSTVGSAELDAGEDVEAMLSSLPESEHAASVRTIARLPQMRARMLLRRSIDTAGFSITTILARENTAPNCRSARAR
jgi:hypothetical protein